MFIHLESGICTSGIDIRDLAESAAMCFQWSKFIIDIFDRNAMLQGQPIWSVTDVQGNPAKPVLFKCPECDEEFTKLSRLSMHVESPACNQTLDTVAIRKLMKWLPNHHT
jgi:hypothetical protein